MAASGSMSAMWPYMCTGMMARVRVVILRSTSSTSRHHVSGLQSTNTGRQPRRSTAATQDMMVKLGRITSEPAGRSSAAKCDLDRHRAVADRNAVFDAAIARPGLLESGNEAAFRRDPARPHGLVDIGQRALDRGAVRRPGSWHVSLQRAEAPERYGPRSP